jgi:hypothetical protein
VFEDIDSNEQRAAVTRRGSIRIFACYEEIQEKKRSLSVQSFVFDFFKSPSGNRTLPPLLLETR